MVAADGAVGAALDLHVAELGRERVEEEQPADERFADPGRELDRLVRLQRADDPREDAEHAAFGARRRELGRRRLREEAAVARPFVRLEDGDLALEAVDRAVHDRDVVPDRRVVHEVAGREVVGAVDDQVPAVVEDPVDVLRGEALAVGDDVHVGVERARSPASPNRPSACRACRASGRSGAAGSSRRRCRRRRCRACRRRPPRGRATPASRARPRRSGARARRAASAAPPRRSPGSAGGASSASASPARASAAARSRARCCFQSVIPPASEWTSRVAELRQASSRRMPSGRRRRSRGRPSAPCRARRRSMRLSRLPRGTWTAPGRCPSCHSSTSRTSTQRAPSSAWAPRGVDLGDLGLRPREQVAVRSHPQR